MKRIFVISLFLLCLFASCSNNINDKTTLVVTNKSTNSNQYISQVFVKSLSDSGYKEVYSGKVKKDNSYYLSLTPDIYSVRVKIINEMDVLPIGQNYDAYNTSREFKSSDIVEAVFDGIGLQIK